MKRALVLVLFGLLALAQLGEAAVPKTVSYQGILKDSGGTIVPDGLYTLTFKIYDVDTGGSEIWTEAQTLPVEDGVFNAILGDVTPLSLPFDQEYWLGIAVESDPELSPRVELTSTPYSLNADRLDGLDSSSFSLTGHVHALDGLSDVECPSPANGEVLTYDGGAGEWVNSPVPAGSDSDWTVMGPDMSSAVPGDVGIGLAPVKGGRTASKKSNGDQDRTSGDAKLQVQTDSGSNDAGIFVFFADIDDLADDRAAIYGYRDSGFLSPGSDYSQGSTNNAVTGANWFGDSYSFGVAGYTYFDGPNTGGVFGSNWFGDVWGAMGYVDISGSPWGVFTPNNSHVGGSSYIGGNAQIEGNAAIGGTVTAATDITGGGDLDVGGSAGIVLNLSVGGMASLGGNLVVAGVANVDGFKMAPGATDGYVLTSDGTGVGTWQAPAAVPDSDWSISGADIYRVDGHVGIGTTPAKVLEAEKKGDTDSGTRDAGNSKVLVVANTPDDESALYGYLSDNDDGSDRRAAIFGYRSSGYSNPGADNGVNGTNNAVTGANWYGDPYSYGVAGYTYYDGPSTGGVIGSEWTGSNWGALGYRDASNSNWGVYTPYDIYSGGSAVIGGSADVGGFKLSAGSGAGKVLTSDASGVGTWQTPSTIGGGGSANYLPKFTSANTLGNSGIYQTSSDEFGIGNSAASAKLDVTTSSDDAIEGRCTHTTTSDYAGVIGVSTPTDFYGLGGRFEGGWIGVDANVYPTGNYSYTAVDAYASGGSGTNYGVYASATGSGTNYAGYFAGNVTVTGTLSKGGGSFKIDHPLDPENQYLYHSFVESPDMMNIYNGNAVLDDSGEAWVEMPEWFEALNMEFRYQLTCIGGFAQVYIAEEIQDNRFKIAGGSSGLKVSWQVTGIRHDAFAEANRIPVEEMKPANERGFYLHAESLGADPALSLAHQRQQLKEQKLANTLNDEE